MCVCAKPIQCMLHFTEEHTVCITPSVEKTGNSNEYVLDKKDERTVAGVEWIFCISLIIMFVLLASGDHLKTER